VAQSEIVHAFLEGTTCRDLVRELGRSPPVDSNELFDIATSFASGEEAVGAIFDGKKGKRVDDTPAEGSKSKELCQRNKRGKKGKKPHREAREQGRELLRDIHAGIYGRHAAPRTLVGNAFHQGFYWPTAVADASEIVCTCKGC
jgi:hypothetical protein